MKEKEIEELSSYESYDYCLTLYTYGETIWQGAYVLNIDTEKINVRGKITHNSETDVREEEEHYRYKYFPYQNQIQRSLYIDDVLYTISQAKIKAKNLENVEEISTVELPYEENYPFPLYKAGV